VTGQEHAPAGPGSAGPGPAAPRPARPGGIAESAGAELDAMLGESDLARADRYPGDRPGRQPVHTCYVPANAFWSGVAAEWGRQAMMALEAAAPDPDRFGAAMNLPAADAADVRSLVLAKLASEPVEDLRIDFEDGYHPDVPAPSAPSAGSGAAPVVDAEDADAAADADAAEDADARAAARALADAIAAGAAPPFTGLRCKSLEPATRRRAIATLDEFLGTLVSSSPLPAGFVITLPKVTAAVQVEAMALLCERLELAHGLEPGQLVFEVQVETPQAVLGADGAATLARCVHAAAGRLTGLHYGTYDYSAALGIAAAYQSMEHPAADYARAVMQVAAAGTGVRLSDGSSNVLPVGDREAVVAAWRLHARLVRRSLERGFYQGWDMHPAQLVSRYAATYAFFRAGLASTAARLSAGTQQAGTQGAGRRRGGGTLEEPATLRALAGYLTRGLDCGAVSAAEVHDLTGLDRAALDALRQAGR
jgi:citrate lyase beta subunit